MITPRKMPTVESVARHYDELDIYYRDLWGEHVHHGLWRTGRETPEEACEQLIRLAAEEAGVGEGMLVCDVGSGYGGTARFLANVYRARVTGVTVSEVQFRYACAQANGAGNPCYLLQDWGTNPFADDSFDAVVSIECLAHIADKQRYFSEIARVLRPGRKAAIFAWLAHPAPRHWEVRRLLEPICTEGRLLGMGSADEYEKMIRRTGMTLVRYQELSRNVRKTWWVCTRRLLVRLCTSPKYFQGLFDSSHENRVFARTLFRILAAYHTGAMQYGLLVVKKTRGTRRSSMR